MAEQPNYHNKIKTREELRDLIGSRPRQQTVLMCHGTFDLVHPGHVRHLTYSKSKADVLIVSLTADVHITKANFRPFVPQDLRAMNLAALEAVDYVMIDNNPTPLETIRTLEPDIFAKGFEYIKDGIRPSTTEEVAALEAYGGQIIFSPGDVVYSSSAFIEEAPPQISAQKLEALMNSEGITFNYLRQIIDSFGRLRIHVIGDTIIDSYNYCTIIGSMAKTPTFSVRHERETSFLGGAAVVSNHLRQAGAHVKLSTVLGEDNAREFVLKELESQGIECYPSIEPTRPTTVKTVFIGNDYRLLKVDKLDNRPISQETLEQLRGSLSKEIVDAYIFSDFRHGIFTPQTIEPLTSVIPQGTLKAADSQVASRWGNILDFRGFDLITPNEREARFALGDQDSVIRPLALSLYEKAQCETLILKLGERGLLTYRSSEDKPGSFFTIDSFAGRTIDPVGAGDALLAYSTLGLVATKSPAVASILGTMAAAIACEQDGNAAVHPEDVLSKLDIVEKQLALP